MQIDWDELWQEVHQIRQELAQRLFPPTNCLETPAGYRYEVMLLGYAKGDLQLRWEDNKLIISASPALPALPEGETCLQREYSIEAFERVFDLPDNAEPEAMEARFEEGILYIFLPKK